MSKITPKNLSYDTSLPPFLARLQAQNANNDGRQDFHAARPKKPRDADADREDEPVYFDEVSGDTLTKGEWEEREKFEQTRKIDANAKQGDGNGGEVELDGAVTGSKEREKLAAIGGARKRKAGRIIGGVEKWEGESNATKKVASDKKIPGTRSEGKKVEKGGKAVKKGKNIKLSFGDDE